MKDRANLFRYTSLHRRVYASGACLVVCLLLLSLSAVAQPFTDVNAGLPDVQDGALAWGDYDNDGDLDLLLTGDSGAGAISRIYRNDAGSFTNIGASLENVDLNVGAWGDYDGDGDLDIMLSGRGSGQSHQTRLYRNDGGNFVSVSTNLPGLLSSAGAWGDYDNDGDLDLMLSGRKSNLDNTAAVYRNEAGTFVETSGPFVKLRRGALAWGDYDADGDLDLVMTGRDDAEQRQTRLYRNNGGSFVDTGAALPPVDLSSVDWGDFDEDGDLDLLLGGTGNSGFVTDVYRNTGGVFAPANAGLPAVEFCALRWGDYDNDGDLDVLLSGADGTARIARIYRNNGGSFTNINAGLVGVSHSAAAWGDYDGDGDLDLVLTGNDETNNHTVIYRNGNASVNSAPLPPENLVATQTGTNIRLSWSAGSDAEMIADGLTYNLRVGVSPGTGDVMPAQSLAGGTRQLAAHGNVFQNVEWTLSDLPVGQTFYWSVQAVDGGYAGSTFAVENQFVVNAPNAAPIATADAFTLSGFVPARIDVLANDSDADGDGLRVIAVDNPTLQGGFAFIGVDGAAVHYIPSTGFLGIDSFTYSVSDGNGAVAQAEVQIMVNDIAPVSVTIPDTTGIAGETLRIPVSVGDLTGKNILAYTFQLAYDPTILEITQAIDVGTTSEGQLVDLQKIEPTGDIGSEPYTVLVGSLSSSAFEGGGTLIYLDAELQGAGTSALVFTDFFFNEGHPLAIVTDGSIAVTAQISASFDEAVVEEDGFVSIDVLQNDTHQTGEALMIAAVSIPEYGSTAIDTLDQRIVYTPAPDFNGSDFFEYTVTAADGFEATSFVTVTVLPVNDAPTLPIIQLPADGAEILLGASQGEAPLPAAALFEVEWTASVDPDGDEVSYTWTLSLMDDFTAPLLSLPTAGPLMQTRVGDVVEALREQGISDFLPTIAYHRVAVADGDTTVFGPSGEISLTIGELVGVSNESVDESAEFSLLPGYPNPFIGRVDIPFTIAEPGPVQLFVFDVLGREIAKLVDNHLGSGRHEISFDATGLPSGIYVVRLDASGRSAQQVVVATR